MFKKIGVFYFLFLCFSVSASAATIDYCLPTQSCWPTENQWHALSDSVGGRLMKVDSPVAACETNSNSQACKHILLKLQDPFYLEDQPGATQITGTLGGWQSSLSAFAVAVTNSDDIAKTVIFSKKHHLKLVIKGTGHDYLGRSNAPNSLLVWTHHMRDIQIDDQFKASGCKDDKGEPAVTMGAGTRWIEAYKAVTVDHGRYVQGGTCTSVGVAGGFSQGGGYGSFSKKFGTAAGNILQAEVVTADGRILIVNRCQNSDLFWALKGGGGGTFAIVSKITLRTHTLPDNFGMINGEIEAKTSEDYQLLIAQFIHFYKTKLSNEHWGDGMTLSPNNKMVLWLLFQGLNEQQAKDTWHDFVSWVKARPKQYTLQLETVVIPARRFWDYDYLIKHFPLLIMSSQNKQIPADHFWWYEDQAMVSTYLTNVKSRYLPSTLFDKAHSKQLSDALFNASRFTDVEINLYMGLAGASKQALTQQNDTAMRPDINQMEAFVVLATVQQNVFPTIQALRPDLAKAKADAELVNKAAKFIYEIAPDAGAYVNEADYFEQNWQQSFWGKNYARLLTIKKRVDPDGIFKCHHCVGSEI